MQEEIFPLVSDNGEVIGQATRSFCHGGTKPLHPVVHLHVFNRNGQLFLQKRSLNKDIQPGKWDTAVGGHIAYGESIEDGLRRESKEELGIDLFRFDRLYCYEFESEIERELVYTFSTCHIGEITTDETEISEGRFWDIEEIRQNIGKGIFTPNFEKEFSMLQAVLL